MKHSYEYLCPFPQELLALVKYIDESEGLKHWFCFDDKITFSYYNWLPTKTCKKSYSVDGDMHLWNRPPSHHLDVSVMLNIVTFLWFQNPLSHFVYSVYNLYVATMTVNQFSIRNKSNILGNFALIGGKSCVKH